MREQRFKTQRKNREPQRAHRDCRFVYYSHICPVFLILALLNILFAACSTTPKQISPNLSSPPYWVSNKDLAFPESQWLVGTGKGSRVETAENSATLQLAQRFRVDISTRSSYREQVNETFIRMGLSNQGEFRRTTDYINDVYRTSSISDIIGLIVDNWTDPLSGEIHAIARMNRAECTNRYTEIIDEYEKNISQLISKSSQSDLIDQIKILNFAYNLALITDDLHNIRTILSPSYINHSLDYGSAISIKAMLPDIKKEIVVYVEVAGDVNDRILRAFTATLNHKGFRTSQTKINNYKVNVFYDTEEIFFPDEKLKHIRYTINYSFLDPAGKEIFSGSHNDREAHNTIELAKNRALQWVERWVESDGFAAEFEEFLRL